MARMHPPLRPGAACAAAARAAALLALPIALAPAGARAQQAPAASAQDWVVTLGGSMALAPSYEGSRTSTPVFMPSFDLRRADEPATFGAPDDSFGFGLFDFSGFRFGVLAGIRDGRPNWIVPGLPGYTTVLQGGGFAEYWPVEGLLRTRVELLQGLGGSGGLAANLSADLVQVAGPFTFAVGPRLSLADSVLMQTEFGVSPLSAALNGRLTPFDADAGVKSLGIATSLSYEVTKDWTTTVFGSYQRLAGAAASSPTVLLGGSPNQITLGLDLEHSFVLGH